jgi:hypothetical protein
MLSSHEFHDPIWVFAARSGTGVAPNAERLANDNDALKHQNHGRCPQPNKPRNLLLATSRHRTAEAILQRPRRRQGKSWALTSAAEFVTGAPHGTSKWRNQRAESKGIGTFKN